MQLRIIVARTNCSLFLNYRVLLSVKFLKQTAKPLERWWRKEKRSSATAEQQRFNYALCGSPVTTFITVIV